MITLTIDNKQVEVEEGTTILQAAEKLGIKIPTLCHHKSLAPYGACRVCLVEVGSPGRSSWVQASCVYPAQEDQIVQTNSERVQKTRKIMFELLLARCPDSPVIRDLAKEYGVEETRFPKKNEDCILCGLCTRICEEQMMAKAIGFRGRGEGRSIGTPFDIQSDVCRQCGACIYVCPACELRCTYTEAEKAVCGGCANLSPPCIEVEQFDDMMCYMNPCVACEAVRR